MKKLANLPFLVVFAVILVLFACKQNDNKDNGKETILKGKVTIIVDETLKPIIEDQIEVFENKYEAKITLDAKSEKELVQAFLKDTSSIVVLSRKLTADESKKFEFKKIVPKQTIIGTDAIAFIANKNNKDTLIALQDVIHFMQGKRDSKIKGLVFDNPNSSTVRFMNELAGLKEIPEKGIFSFKINDEVIKFVSENDGMIGIVGVNWLSQPLPAMKDYVKKVNVLNVKGLAGSGYFAPTQNNIAEGTYPLARDLYIINCQGYSGLGMGFASFVAGEVGQRIILKSGLLPVRTPGRKMLIRNGINNDKENEKK
ncbi:PstS family phosphate ABC transporter substrate-binding protein [Flavobacterium sp. K5-23]|uniref:PstS family phosphate ABC transporter substrate-binding protein n=1 Tax=Flavobacterium sp. K5-23 TaxID=2746225 RepID=UPI00200D5C0E|nr:substrate-binding domain-containing protein [Flavobacterium sp. K5-23]UQD55988.1 substrate-binding domain-containing protein [Flavobacterium sp. K5-23]